MIRKIAGIILLSLITLSSSAQKKHHLSEFITRHDMNGLVKSDKLMVYEKIAPEPTFYPGEIMVINEWGEELTVSGYYKIDSSQYTYDTIPSFKKFEVLKIWDKEKRLIHENYYNERRDLSYDEDPFFITFKKNHYSYNKDNYLIKKTCSYSFQNLHDNEQIDSNLHTTLIAYDVGFEELTEWEFADNIYFFKDSLLQMAFSQKYYFNGVNKPNVRIYQYDEQNKLIGIKMQWLNYGNEKPIIDTSKYIIDIDLATEEENEYGEYLSAKYVADREETSDVKLDKQGNWIHKKTDTLFWVKWVEESNIHFNFERTLEYYK